ncbi:MAG: hypothetical protein M3M94_04900 [Actinomycetota bacterium]|nr:hypothetical protein [Actinomycetota bacterium]
MLVLAIAILAGPSSGAEAPQFTIDDVTVTEGDSGNVTATFTVTLSQTPSGGPMSVDWATANGTATAPGDYAAANGTVTFADGATDLTQPVAVTVKPDTVDEHPETFKVKLTNAQGGAAIGDDEGVGTINDDANDVEPSVSIGNASASEGDAVPLPVTLSAVSGKDVTVNYTAMNDTANSDDYAGGAGSVVIPAGSQTASVSVATTEDVIDEPEEKFTVDITSAQNATVNGAKNRASGTIVDDDGAPTLSIDDKSSLEGDSGATEVKFIVTLSGATASTVTVNWATKDDTAKAGSDYVGPLSSTLSFPPGVGSRSQEIAIQVNGDALDELEERLFVDLANPTNAQISKGRGTLTITDDDDAPSVSVNDVGPVGEGHAGTQSAVFTVKLSAASGQTVKVNWATANGGPPAATADADYVASAPATLTFEPGQPLTQQITVGVKGDTLDEDDEKFNVNLSNAVNATISDAQGVGTIADDDEEPRVSVGDATGVSETDAATKKQDFTISLSAPSGRTVKVDYATVDGSAKAGSDYVATHGTLTFNAGDRSKTVSVAILDDSIAESNESFTVRLSNLVNVLPGDVDGTGTVIDNDGTPRLTLTPAELAKEEGDDPAKNKDYVFTVVLSPASGQQVTVNYATSEGTAKAGSDYVETKGTLTFAPTQTSCSGGATSSPCTIVVPVKSDTDIEADEKFTLRLSSATGGASIASGDAVATIINNDVDTAAPSAPASLAATPASETQIGLSWNAANDNVGVKGYRVFRGGVQIAETTATTYTDTGLAPGTAYTYTVRAFDEAKNVGPESNAATATTLSPAPPPPPPPPPPPGPPPPEQDRTPPTAPSGLTGKYTSDQKVALIWTAATDNDRVSTYRIYRDGQQVGASIFPRFDDTTAMARKRHTYVVRAEDPSGNVSGESNVFQITLPAPPGPASFAAKALTMDDGFVTIPVTCARLAKGECDGKLTITARVKMRVVPPKKKAGRATRPKAGRRARARFRTVTVTLGSGAFIVSQGQTDDVTVELNQRGQKLIKQRKRLTATVTLTARVARKAVTLKRTVVIKVAGKRKPAPQP